MTLSRRQFIKYVLGSAAAAGIQIPDLLGAMEQAAPSNQTGELSESVLANLMAMVEAFVADYGSTRHYREYFRWRAENLPGYKVTYELFSGGLDEAARSLGERSFAGANESVHREILQRAMELPTPGSALDDPRISGQHGIIVTPEERLWLYFDRMVIGEMIQVFIQTNAWVMLGYDGWPGQARGLANYLLPVDEAR